MNPGGFSSFGTGSMLYNIYFLHFPFIGRVVSNTKNKKLTGVGSSRKKFLLLIFELIFVLSPVLFSL